MFIIHTSIGYISKVSRIGDYQITHDVNDAKCWSTQTGAEKAERRIRKVHSGTLSNTAMTIMEMKKSVPLFSRKKIIIPKNTPLCCDPSSETYWSM